MVRKFGMVPHDQFEQMRTEKPSVMRLWCECWATDPFGTRWMPLETELVDKTLKVAKARLRELKYFDFQSEVTFRGEQRYWKLFVLNLQGSQSRQFDGKQPTTKTAYQEFLASDYWQYVRQQILQRDNYTCQCCGATDNLHVHHNTYKNHGYEHEHLEDLDTLCHKCHKQIHEWAKIV